MPAIYKVTTATGVRIIKANSQAHAKNHVLKDLVTVKTLKAAEVADAMADGAQLETASAEEKETPADHEPKAQKGLSAREMYAKTGKAG